MNSDASSGTISEATFLVTELRYTLGQLHVQLGEMDRETRAAMMCGDRSAETILQELIRSETEYQSKYAHLLQVKQPSIDDGPVAVPLPMREDDSEEGAEQPEFEQLRSRTIAMLDEAGDNWPAGLVELVKEQVGGDRQHTTDLAECRRQFLGRDQHPNLNESLTAGNQ